MSHGDVITKAPEGARVVATSGNDHPAAMVGKNFWAVQFHPEVAHTEGGLDFVKAFLFDFCKAKVNWSTHTIADHLLHDIKTRVGAKERVLCALSGGVDSTVVATLLTKALGASRVKCVFVDNGLLRKDEFAKVQTLYKELGLDVLGYDARTDFLSKLNGVEDPETKRKIIGSVFIDVFKKAFAQVGECQWLAQGTLYPDVIESVSPRGTSVTIKSHHNVGGLPKDLGLKLIEPLRELFKDEVRRIGADLGIPKKFLWRHPFPGPGLAIRLIGPINETDLDILKEVDAIYIGELEKQGLYDKIWQAFCVLLPVKTVGVQGDNRTYDKVVALRAGTSTDGMTADWYPFDAKFMAHVSNRITNEVRGVNRVVYDVTSKPPGTIEWE
jgi:GMP synthase (glutamine-hydrolysing)